MFTQGPARRIVWLELIRRHYSVGNYSPDKIVSIASAIANTTDADGMTTITSVKLAIAINSTKRTCARWIQTFESDGFLHTIGQTRGNGATKVFQITGPGAVVGSVPNDFNKCNGHDNDVVNNGVSLGIVPVVDIDARDIRRNPTIDERRNVFGRDGGKCLRCFAKCCLVLDHIVPHACGGMTTESNLQTLCRKCNRTKFIEAIDYRRSLSVV